MKIFLWKHLVNPLIAGFFFALGHFIVYFLSKTKFIKSLESYIIADPALVPTPTLNNKDARKTKAYEVI